MITIFAFLAYKKQRALMHETCSGLLRWMDMLQNIECSKFKILPFSPPWSKLSKTVSFFASDRYDRTLCDPFVPFWGPGRPGGAFTLLVLTLTLILRNTELIDSSTFYLIILNILVGFFSKTLESEKNSNDGLVEIGTLSLCVMKGFLSEIGLVVMIGIWLASFFSSKTLPSNRIDRSTLLWSIV